MKKQGLLALINLPALIFTWALLLSSAVIAEETGYTSGGRRDPFVPLVSSSGYLFNVEEEEETSFRLEGIMYDPDGGSMAIINGELRKVGEKIADAVVSSIEPTKVVIIKDNQRVEIELRREE